MAQVRFAQFRTLLEPSFLAALVVATQMGSIVPAQENHTAGRKLALLVGVKDYQHGSLHNLDFPENDVTELAEVLKSQDFDVVVLTTALAKNDPNSAPTADNIRKRLSQLLEKQKVNKRDVIVVGLAGHGLQPVGSKEAYFCPSDANPTIEGDKPQKPASLIAVGEILKQLDDSGIGHKLLLVDACRNDPSVRGRRGMERVDVSALPPQTGVLLSCATGEFSFENKSLGTGHGVFFYHVIEGLRGAAQDTDDHEITWEGLKTYVRRKVPATVKRLYGKDGGEQQPNDIGNMIGEPTVLAVAKIATRSESTSTPEQPPPTTTDGWATLFNAQDLTGWTPEHCEGIWSVRDGVLTSSAGSGAGWLATDREYSDFELTLEYRLPAGGNSGVFVRMPKSGVPIGADFMEVQLQDDASARPQERTASHRTGAIYNILGSSRAAVAPANSWNKVSIRFVGREVSVRINDADVLQGNLERIAAGKRVRPDVRRTTGSIGLQWNRASAEFRNIRIRRIDSAERPESLEASHATADGWTALFNGRDLNGWTPRNSAGVWSVREGVLTATPGRGMGWLASQGKYSDFELELEYFLPEQGNSGVFLRIPQNGAPSGVDFIEVQLQDDAAAKYQALANWHRTGAIYGILGPSTPAEAPANRWNKLFIRFVGPEVNVTINDVQVLQGNLERATADKPARPDVRRTFGYIGLQWNRSKAEFRKIRIRPL
jgi:hypothetical protein